MFNWIKKTKIYLSYKDIYNYILFRKIINKEEKTPNSKYNKLKFQRNSFYTLNFIVTLPEETYELTAEQRRLYLTDAIQPHVEYIGEELGFSEYIVAEAKQFFDQDGPTLSYGVIFSFVFNTLSFKLILKWLIYILIIIGIFVYNNQIFHFFKNLF